MNAPEARAPLTVRLRTLVLVLAGLVVLAGAGGWLLVYLGLYNVAATVQHTAPVYRLLHYAMFRSVKARADVRPPPDLMAPAQAVQGAVLYRGHCVQCHGAPGVPPEPFAMGLRPEPVNLVPPAREWAPAELFRVIKHGIKMTGMPSWQYRMADEDIWRIVGFVRAMAAMSPQEYAQLVQRLPQHHHDTAAPGAAQAHHAPRIEPDAATRVGALGSASQGRHKIQAFLCATCHEIPGIVGANHHVGPPLDGIGGRAFIAGVVRNEPQQMIRFLLDPQRVAPGSAMPPLGLNEEDARDIAAYLYTLRAP